VSLEMIYRLQVQDNVTEKPMKRVNNNNNH